MTGADLHLPAADPPAGTVTLESYQRGSTGGPDRITVPNWRSDRHMITVMFDDFG